MNWIAVVIEAVVGAPLWAFAHLDTDGEGMGSRTQYGYIFVLNVMFMPLLMVVGFVSSAVVVNIVGDLFNKLYPIAIASAQAESMTGLMAIVALLAIYCTTCVSIVNTCFSLTHTIPDNTMRWIGGQISPRHGSEMSGNFTQATSAVVGAQANLRGGGPLEQLGKSRDSAAQSRGNAAKEKNDERRHKENIGALGGNPKSSSDKGVTKKR